jgi:hypothetical protein
MEDEPRQPTLDASPRGKTTGIHRLANDRLDGAGGFIWNDDVHIYIYTKMCTQYSIHIE